ncbi:MAG: hypothetical protein FWB99_04920, partial [Treponema sp.]|nr:hypothetical protein [Treponema sp.]
MTVTIAEPDTAGSATDAAKTKSVGDHSFGATVSKPLALITVLGATTPVPAALELTRHVTAVLGLLFPVTVALNWMFLLVNVAKLAGLIVTPVTMGPTGGGGGGAGGSTETGGGPGAGDGAGVETGGDVGGGAGAGVKTGGD